MTHEAIITDNQHSIVIDPPVSTHTVVIDEHNTVVVEGFDHQTTVVTGLLGPAGKNGAGLSSYAFGESLEWLVQHNKNTRAFIAVLFDSAGSQFFAKVDIVNANSFVVRLTEPVAGSVTVMFQG
jgi:hypothetical protein